MVNEFAVSNTLYIVDGQYFRTSQLGNGATLKQQLPGQPPGEIPSVVDSETWEQMSQSMIEFGKAESQQNDIGLYSDVFENLIATSGDQMLRDPSIIELMGRVPSEFMNGGEFDDTAFNNAYRQTNYFNSTTERQRLWASSSDAEKAVAVQNSLGEVANLWRLYTGENVTLPGTIAELQADPQFKGWYSQAFSLAQGTTSQNRLLNQWLQPIAEGIEGSPWSRRLMDEEKAGKQQSIDIDDKRADVRDMSQRYGLELSDEKLEQYSTQIVNNDLSDDDLETLLDKQSSALYAYKPAGMDWNTYADPYRRAHSALMETALPDHTDEGLQDALQAGSSLSDYKLSLRKRPEWLSTENAQSTLISELSAAGRRMGFG